MSLRMADGPPAHLPPGCDAYAGYIDQGGIGVTWPAVQRIPARYHLSISVHGAPAMCGDVERGALASWKGYTVGYCAASQADALIARDGRPRKLWTAHYDPAIGEHICGPHTCGLVRSTTADGTQWTDHGGAWDESVLSDSFFDFLAAPKEEDVAYLIHSKDPAGADYDAVTDGITAHRVHEAASLQAWETRLGAPLELTWGDYSTYTGAI